MANHKGSEGVLIVGTSAVAELRGWNLDEKAAIIDDTTLTDDYETKQAGNKSWSGGATAWWDETDTNGQEALTVGAAVTLKFHMEGTGTGATYKSGAAVVESVGQAAAINGIVERNFSFTGNGTLTQTTV